MAYQGQGGGYEDHMQQGTVSLADFDTFLDKEQLLTVEI